MGHSCGFASDCNPPYTAADVESSALQWDPSSKSDAAALQARHVAAMQSCNTMEHTSSSIMSAKGNGRQHGTLDTGGWCLSTQTTKGDAFDWVSLTNQQSYFLPRPHLAADRQIVKYLDALLSGCNDALIQGGHCNRRPGLLSVNDFGAGVGQYGRALLSIDERHRWTGYDGAGNVRNATGGFVKFFDLSMPLSLPRADWVLSLEVGEHVPPAHEMMYLRNLHAHACQGLVLSWAYLGKYGVGHVNTHSDRYLRSKILPLGYVLDTRATDFLRHSDRLKFNTHAELQQRNVSSSWFWLRSVAVYRRITPRVGEGCTQV